MRGRIAIVALAALAATAVPVHAAPNVKSTGWMFGNAHFAGTDGRNYWVGYSVTQEKPFNGDLTQSVRVRIVESSTTCDDPPECPRWAYSIPAESARLTTTPDLSEGTLSLAILGTRFVARWATTYQDTSTYTGWERNGTPVSVARGTFYRGTSSISAWGATCPGHASVVREEVRVELRDTSYVSDAPAPGNTVPRQFAGSHAGCA